MYMIIHLSIRAMHCNYYSHVGNFCGMGLIEKGGVSWPN